MDKKSKNPNVPNLRFHDFDSKYQKYFLDEQTMIFDGTHQTPNYKQYGIPFVSVEDIKNLNNTKKFISCDDYKKDFKISPQFNDILMTRIGDIGTPTLIVDHCDRGYYVSLALIRPLEKIYSPYLKYLIEAHSFQHELWKKTIHVAFPKKINKEDIGKCEINFCEMQEQKKISDFLEKIDECIQAQSKIIDDLLTVKNGISNKLFKLQQIELSNHYLSEYLTEGDKTAVDTSCYKKITVKLNKQGLAFSELNREMADTRPFYVRHKGELIIGKQNYFNGSIAVVTEQFDNCICSNAIMSFKINNIDSDFLYYQISNNNYLNSQSYKANGTGQKELSEKEFLNFKIWCPHLEVQQKIVNCFKSFDLKIENEKAILDSYIQEKNYLLNNMFI